MATTVSDISAIEEAREAQYAADEIRIEAAARLGTATGQYAPDSESYQQAENDLIVATHRWLAAFLAECRAQAE